MNKKDMRHTENKSKMLNINPIIVILVSGGMGMGVGTLMKSDLSDRDL